MEDYVKELGIDKIGEYNKDDSYVIDLANSNEFSKIYSILSKNSNLEELDDSSTLTADNSNVVFTDDNHVINLIADFEADKYKVTFTEM